MTALGKEAGTLAVALFVLLLPSCQANHQVFIEADGSGCVRARIELARVFADYLLELAELTGSGAKLIFNTEEIRKGFEANPLLSLNRIRSAKAELLELEISFHRIQELFAPQAEQRQIVSLRQNSEEVTLAVHVDRGNVDQIEKLFPFLNNPLFEGLGPRENDSTSEKEYLEMIELIMGPEGAQALKSSFLEVHFKPQGILISQSGGRIRDGSALFRIPLLQVLLLDKPLDYTVVFK